MLHGYSHKNFPDGFEFQVAPDLESRLRRGRTYLEQLFERPIRTFVPPHNALGRRGPGGAGRGGARRAGLVSLLSSKPEALETGNAGELPADLSFSNSERGADGRSRLIYPFPLRYKNHAEFGCHLLLPWTQADELIAGFEQARRLGGDFCLATHYWEIDDHMAGVLRTIVEHADKAGARFVAGGRAVRAKLSPTIGSSGFATVRAQRSPRGDAQARTSRRAKRTD